MAGFQLDYKSLLVNADYEARNEYDFDPRVAFLATADAQRPIEPINYTAPTTVSAAHVTIEELNEAPDTQDTLTLPVQQPPSMVPRARMIVIDTAQRDWTLQQTHTPTYFHLEPRLLFPTMVRKWFITSIIPQSRCRRMKLR